MQLDFKHELPDSETFSVVMLANPHRPDVSMPEGNRLPEGFIRWTRDGARQHVAEKNGIARRLGVSSCYCIVHVKMKSREAALSYRAEVIRRRQRKSGASYDKNDPPS